MRKRIFKGVALLAVIVMAGVTAGCRMTIMPQAGFSPGPSGKSSSGIAGIPAFASGGGDVWWQVFNDPDLEVLVVETLAQNASLQAMWRRLEQSGYAAAAVRSSLYPQLTLSGFGGRARRLQMPEGDITETATWGVSAGLSYELDVWRRISAAGAQAGLQMEAAALDYEVMAISLTAAVCEAWFELQERRLAVALFGEQLETSEANLEAVEQRYRRGLGSLLDVYQQRELVAGVRSQIPEAEALVSLARNRLAVLTGQAPGGEMGVGPARLPAAPALPETMIMAEDVSGRPDVKAAQARLQAAEQGAAATWRERLPGIRLSANAATQAEATAGLFEDITGEALIGLSLPLVDGGRRRAEAARAASQVSERLATYVETLRQAMREVHDASVLEAAQVEREMLLNEELAAARRTLELSTHRYRSGLIDYLGVLTAQARVQRLERSLLRAQRLRLSYRIQYSRARAGSVGGAAWKGRWMDE